jgi:hypothetical protein
MRLERETADPSCGHPVRFQAISSAQSRAAGQDVTRIARPGITTDGRSIWTVSFLVSYIHVHRRGSAFIEGR